MEYKYFVILIFATLCFSCLRRPSAKITDQYIELVKPGYDYGLIELANYKLDSTGCPVDRDRIVSYKPVYRKTHERIDPNSSVKLLFKQKNEKYCWANFIVGKDSLEHVSYTDTIHIEPFHWYSLWAVNLKEDIYFHGQGNKNSYIIRTKPKPQGPW